MTHVRAFVTAAALLLVASTHAGADTLLTTVHVAGGFSLPSYVTAPPGDTRHLFVVEQRSGTTGRIKIINLDTGTTNATPFLSIAGVSTGNEQGLLGLAFHPNYASNGYFYVDYTDSGGTIQIRRYTVSSNPDLADPNSAFPILSQPHPSQTNHNGGWIAFGADSYLYIALGDGGGTGDPFNNAQNLNALLGKLLRIDVDHDDFPADPARNYANPPTNPFVGVAGADEIWAWGLRNPWRCSFDRLTHDLYIADVGQGDWEEIDFQPAAGPGGVNYGWPCYEGNASYDTNDCASAGNAVFPIHTFGHVNGNCSVTGGYVYRGDQICDLRGTYFFADYCSDSIWSFRYDGANLTDFRDRTAELAPAGGPAILSITSFGEDAHGEMYIVARTGNVFKIVPDGPAKGDLDNSGTVDFGDINAFVLAVSNPSAYTATYGLLPAQAGDLDCNGTCGFGDINPFVALLSGAP